MEYKAGQVLLFERNGPLDIMGYVLATEEGDTNYSHGAIVAKDPEYLWTTGAKKRYSLLPPFVKFCYGKVRLEDYCKNRTFSVAECVDPLTPTDIDIIESTHEKWEGQRYGLEKVEALLLKKYQGRFIATLSNPPETPDLIKNPYCTEAVSGVLWKVNRMVCRDSGKLSPDAITPAALAMAANYSNVIKWVKGVV